MDNAQVTQLIFIIGLILAFVAGAVSRGMGLKDILAAFNADIERKNQIEQSLFEAVPPSALEAVNQIANGSLEVSKFLLEKFSFPGIPTAVSHQIQEVANVVEGLSEAVANVTDGKSEIPFASKGLPPNQPAA